jgi:hypothetical protein
MRQGGWKYLLGQRIRSCINHPFNTFDPISKDALQFSIWNAIQIPMAASRRLISSESTSPTSAFFTFPSRSKSDGDISREYGGRGSLFGGLCPKRCESSLSCGRVNCKHALPIFFALHSTQPRKFSQLSVRCWTMKHWIKLLEEAL